MTIRAISLRLDVARRIIGAAGVIDLVIRNAHRPDKSVRTLPWRRG